MDLKEVIFRSERVDLGLIGLISGLNEPDLGLNGLRRGDVRMDGYTDGRKEIHPCVLHSYRTSALWGRCPKRGPTNRPTDRRTKWGIESCSTRIKKALIM